MNLIITTGNYITDSGKDERFLQWILASVTTIDRASMKNFVFVLTLSLTTIAAVGIMISQASFQQMSNSSSHQMGQTYTPLTAPTQVSDNARIGFPFNNAMAEMDTVDKQIFLFRLQTRVQFQSHLLEMPLFHNIQDRTGMIFSTGNVDSPVEYHTAGKKVFQQELAKFLSELKLAWNTMLTDKGHVSGA